MPGPDPGPAGPVCHAADLPDRTTGYLDPRIGTTGRSPQSFRIRQTTARSVFAVFNCAANCSNGAGLAKK